MANGNRIRNLLTIRLTSGAAGARGCAREGLGFVDAAVTCLGARGGDSVEGRKSKIGLSNSSTL